VKLPGLVKLDNVLHLPLSMLEKLDSFCLSTGAPLPHQLSDFQERYVLVSKLLISLIIYNL